MRNARWVNRFLYAWNDTLFYDPLDVAYAPRPDNFLSSLDDETQKRFVRSGLWWSYRHNRDLPSQGWKIHVSADHVDVRRVADTVVRYLVARNTDFKIALDLNIYEMLNSKGMSRGSAGKLVTIYPADEAEFRECLADLEGLLEGVSGAYVLSDLRYKESKALYFRYGQFLDTHSVDIMGKRAPYIVDPAGEQISDVRRPVFSKPPWAAWPFADWSPEEPAPVGLLDGRFRVVEALKFSNTGGIYRAQDVSNADRTVLLKEARPGTNVNPRLNYDAVDTLKREWEFLTRLSDTGHFPSPVAYFGEWEHHFLAEEFIEGVDIRTVLFTHNPLVQVSFGADESRTFLGIYLKIFDGLCTAMQAAHARNIVIGDFNATNLIILPDTFEVRILDLEAARLVEASDEDQHLQQPIDLYTPGFSRSRGTSRHTTVEDDLYGLASTVAYLIFPIAAMSYLRGDVFTLYRDYIDDLGWPAEIHDLIVGLSTGTISLDAALAVVREPERLLAKVELRPRRSVDEVDLDFADVEMRLSAFVAAAADPDRASLFPVDPFAHLTNPLSLGFGASGILHTLNSCGHKVDPKWLAWLGERIAKVDVKEYPTGYLNGLAGIAWAIDGLGMDSVADELLSVANREPNSADYTFYYGLAGIGMTNLHFYARRGATNYLQAAEACAKELCARAEHDGEHAYWLNEFAADGPMTGLGFGQAGVALFLLRMYQVTKDEAYLKIGERALGWEMAHAVDTGNGSVTFSHEGTALPYVEVGSAGVAQVLLRYGLRADAEKVLRGLRRVHSVMPGYLFGMSGVIDAMLDAATILQVPSYRSMALEQFDYIRRIFLFAPSTESPVRVSADLASTLAVPGEGLLRCTCDLATGSAGVLRVVHRLRTGHSADFLLDGLRS